MYFSRATIHPNIHPNDLSNVVKSEAYGYHAIVWDMFSDSPDRRRDFLFRNDIVGGSPVLYLLSARAPFSTDNVWHIETKEWKPQLHRGMHLEFSLRANPVRSVRNASGRQQRFDVVMDRKKALSEFSGEGDHPPMHVIVQEEGEHWLADRSGKNGFALRGVVADRYVQHRIFKRKGGSPISYSTVDFRGTLEVQDPDVMLRSIQSGIGPAKGFGCGLMMLRRM